MRGILLLSFALALPLHAGTLCFVAAKEKAKCATAEGPKIAIAPADTERTFVWTGSDGKSVTAGVAAAKSETIDLDDKSLRTIALAVRGSKFRGWPADLRVALSDNRKHAWLWEISAKRTEALAKIRVPGGAYRLTLAAERHLTDKRQIDARNDVALKEITLRGVPMVRGRVVSTKDEPVANATISLPGGTVISTADEHGAFETELKEPLPENVVIRAAGFGMKFVPLAANQLENDLGAIRLGAGRKVTLRIIRPAGQHFPVHLLIERELAARTIRRATVVSRDLTADEDSAVVPDLGESDYFVTLSGSGPFERMETRLAIKDSDVEKQVKIEPYQLDIYARLGTEPLLEATLRMFDRDFPMGTEAHVGGIAWAHDHFVGFLRSKATPQGEFVSSPEMGADPSRWDISFPARYITGRIIDRETQKALPAIPIQYLRSTAYTKSYGQILGADDGTYSMLAAVAGTYEFTIEDPEFVPAHETVQISEDSGTVHRDILLSHGTRATIEAQWPNGSAVAGAAVYEGVASDGHNPAAIWQLDGAGRLELAVGKDEHRTLFILPREGSFAIVHLDRPAEGDAPGHVVVPAPAGSLLIHMIDADGKVANAAIGLRFNGEVLPYSVVSSLPQPPGRGEAGLAHMLQLPAGTYEVWALGRNYEPVGQPKTAGISAGESTIELVVPRAR